MKLAQFTDPQILDASAPGGLNPAFGLVSGAFASMGSGTWAGPGLSAPEAMTVSFSGMVATVGLPAPWGVVSSGGVIVRAHGTQTGMDTQTYSVNLAPLVPVSGSLTAYLAATVSTIQQGPFPVPGPPPGHPAYDPNYVPSVAYAATVYTVALAAVSGGIDNVNTFELLRTTLSAGQGAVTGWSTAGQARAADRDAWPATVLPSGGLLSPGEAQYMLLPATSGLTHTLPPASGAGGLMFGGVNPTVGPWTLAATGSDLIAGLGASGGASSLAVPPSGAALLWANAASGIWQLLASSPNMVPQEWTAGNVSSVSGAAVSGGVLTAAPLAGSATQQFSVANATASGQAVALGQFGSLLSASGYQKLPGGWIIQWVQGATFAAGGGDGAPNQFQTVALPIRFPNALLRAWVSTECSAYTYAFDAIWQTVSGSTASAVNVQLQLFGASNPSGADSWPVVFALGW
jgi:hypothetical protein